MNVSLTDEEMIRQYLLQQPTQCFEALYTRYVNKVYGRCLSITQDSEKAQDFTHDIFLKVFDKLASFEQRSSFSTWLYSISFNYCADQLRLAKRLQVSSLDATDNLNLADTQESQLREDAFQVVQQAIATLSAQEQNLLSLKYEEGMSVEQIAKLYSIKASAVKMRLKRSRAKVKIVCVRHYSQV